MTPASADVRWAADTSFAVAALDASHEAHLICRQLATARRPALAGHAVFETYSVLTRLPGAARVSPRTATELLTRAFPERCWLPPERQAELADRMSELGIAGGMVYDALVAAAARHARRVLMTRDIRADRIYDLVGVRHELVA